MSKPRLGIFSLTGCAGDQLMILNMEDELLDLVSRFHIVDFQEGSSYKEEGPIDIAFIEGSASTEHDIKHLKEIRERSNIVIAFGNCAIEGGVQAMRNNDYNLDELMKEVYGVESNYYDSVKPKPLSEYIDVDLTIPGCPVEKEETLRAVVSLLNGDAPQAFTYPVCVECKLNEYACVITEKNKPCLGPVVRAGCEARCPGLGLDCIGCRGAVENGANVAAEYQMLMDNGYDKEFILNRLRVFSGDVDEALLGGVQ